MKNRFLRDPRRGSLLRDARVLATFGLVLPTLAHAACQVESVELPVKMVGSRAVATVGINGTPVPMTVDSGAFYSMLTDAAAEQLALRLKRNSSIRVFGVSGSVEAKTTTVEKLQFLKGEWHGVEFIVGGNEPGAGTMGLMGRNILSLADTEYDLAHGTIRFLFPNDDCGKANMAYWAGSAPVTEIELIDNYRSKTPAIHAKVKLNGTDIVALLDTGATTLVSARAARRAGIAEADMKPAGFVHGVGRGTSKAWTAPFEKFELGGEVIRNTRLHVADIDLEDEEMLLGIDFVLSHRIYISKKQSKMFFTYNGSGPVFALDRSDAPGVAAAATDPAASDVQAATADQLARRGAASAARRDYQSALVDLNKACELEPASAAYFAQRGSIQEALKHPEKALEDFDRALELDATEVDARYRRAWLRFNVKNRDGSKADLDVLDKALAPQAQMRLAMSQLYLNLEQPAQAVTQVNQWLPAHRNEISRHVALNNRCWARVMLGVELDQALDDCDDAVDSDPKNAGYLDSRGWVYLRLGKYQKALSDFDRSIEYRPSNNASSFYGRGLAKTRLGDAAQGSADLAAARKAKPDIDLTMPHTGLTTDPAPKP
jgi:tetratricopeptide (TPR) repeat protein